MSRERVAVSEMANIEVEANSKQRSAAEKRGMNARTAIRVFAAVRLIITVCATNLILLNNSSETMKPLRSYLGVIIKTEEADLVDIVNKKVDYEDARRLIEDARFDRLHNLHRLLFLAAINIPIMGLLWAAAFANKKRCLPIYATLEASQIQECYDFNFKIAFNVLIHQSSLLNPSEHLMTIISIGIALIAYCGLFAPLVLHRYYKFLDEKDKKRERHIYGGFIGNKEPLLSNE